MMTTISKKTFVGYQGISSHPVQTEEMAQVGIYAKFQARIEALNPTQLSQLERRDRIVLLLLDGRRTLHDIARLTHREGPDIARSLVRLLASGYAEFLGA
jgi:hypothetical protein